MEGGVAPLKPRDSVAQESNVTNDDGVVLLVMLIEPRVQAVLSGWFIRRKLGS